MTEAEVNFPLLEALRQRYGERVKQLPERRFWREEYGKANIERFHELVGERRILGAAHTPASYVKFNRQDFRPHWDHAPDALGLYSQFLNQMGLKTLVHYDHGSHDHELWVWGWGLDSPPPTSPEAISPEVLAFTQAMQAELDANAHHGDWKVFAKHASELRLVFELQSHVSKLLKAWTTGDLLKVKEHAADVGNACLFILQHTGLNGGEFPEPVVGDLQ